ncbi:carboxypeptidase-like regulatory domain-containing protein [Cellulophaga baltica]|uniref:TonB-dependent receptor n=1 Tax=Cellulophaga TaxID=104264 RepID=UPI001C07740B|nr:MULTISPECIES: TonB-dependent receptor [Cellulophaga]MBU2995229.1 carboxypeptidase-like regulatory domain-containing protein [Cellulophaga baltica]MDO6766624.1 carboxypeptidase-like regulatory domain-containing protein [Cellulophaga sp. 1_MG-2023]
MTIKNTLLVLSLLFSSIIFAQSGVSGTLFDSEANDVLPFANIFVKGSTKGTTSDFDGKYSIELEPGTYTLIFSYLGYESKEVTGVAVTANKFSIVDITLDPAANALDEVVVTTTVKKNSEASVLQMQKASVKLLDGLSLQSIKRTGANNIASAVKSVPGVSVQGGKYVYVRGLGDRYTKTTLNGMDVPGLDPDRNTLQLDLFPTTILDNIQVVKSFTAESSADFTGGFVDIVTKDIPVRKELGVTVGLTYNSSMHFNKDYLSSDKSSTDFLGFDNGDRDLPFSRSQSIPNPVSGDSELTTLTRSLTPQMGVEKKQNFMNYNMGLAFGNQYNVGETSKLGFQLALNYRYTSEFFEDAENNYWQKESTDSSDFELVADRLQQGDISVDNVLTSALGGIALKTKKSKFRLNLLHIQNGESTNAFFNVETLIDNTVTGVRDNIEYTQRSISNALLAGTHTNEDASWTFDWKLSPTYSVIKDKDIRVTSFVYNSLGNLILDANTLGAPTRIWRELTETNLSGKIDLTKKHELFGNNAKLLFGGGHTYKQRDYGIDQYLVEVRGTPAVAINGDPNNLLLEENIWTTDTDEGTYVSGNYEPVNTFDANSSVSSAYVSEEFQLSDRFKSTLGVRFEKFDLHYTGQNNSGSIVYDNEKIIDVSDIFPTANVIYDLNEEGNTKIRASYGRTTARPSFKEASIAEIANPLNSTVFIGNIDIEPTYISNYDFRFERYGSSSQFFALSGFYKAFKDPIEIVAFEAAPNNFQPQNVSSANVFGAEVELRQGLEFIDAGLREISLNLNVSIIESSVDMSETEYNSRVSAARDGETIEDTRELQGQSPYLINVGFNYNGETNGFTAGMFYNVQGKTLEVVGIRAVPDVYTLPFHNVSMNFGKSFGKEERSKISLRFQNILNDDRESVYQSFGAEDQIYSIRTPGQAISLGYSYKF